MGLSKVDDTAEQSFNKQSTAQRRRNRRKILKATQSKTIQTTNVEILIEQSTTIQDKSLLSNLETIDKVKSDLNIKQTLNGMSSNEISDKSRDNVKAAREAKKLAKQKAKNKDPSNKESTSAVKPESTNKNVKLEVSKKTETSNSSKQVKTADEVDRAILVNAPSDGSDKSKDQVKAERAAKKAAKHAKKMATKEEGDVPIDKEVTKKDVVETLKEITNVAKEVQEIAAKPEESKEVVTTKSKAELKAERRAKQEAQRAAKQATLQPKAPKPKETQPASGDAREVKAKEKSPKPKTLEKAKSKAQIGNKINWFQHLSSGQDKEALKKLAINSNLHPAIVKLGVQLAERTVTGSNARCIALLDALKKMVADYKLPAKTEFARGLESHLAASLNFLWSMRQPTASQTNAVKYFRYHLTQLPNNVDDFDAKKTLHEEIDRYIHEQIDMAGEAISLAVRNKISDGDSILTYECSSLIERILREAWAAGVKFRAVVVGARGGSGRELLRRLVASGVPASYADLTALSSVMKLVDKVVLGAEALLASGSVLGAAGSAHVALAARARNVPVLVACETHHVCERVQTDAFVYNELGDPDDLIKDEEDSPLKDWRANPNLALLNLEYDVTPARLVSAVATERAVLPASSAPVLLRFKLQEYGIGG